MKNILFGLKSEEDEYVSEERELGNIMSDVLLLSSSEELPDPPKSDMPAVIFVGTGSIMIVSHPIMSVTRTALLTVLNIMV